MKRFLQLWGWVPVLAALILVVDQFSKTWIRNNIPLNGEMVPIPAIGAFFRLVHWGNTGAAFGLLRGQGNIFIGVAVVVIVVVLIYLRQLPAEQWPVRLCLALQLGGALGNLVDRIRFGQVTDFLLLTLPVNGRELAWPAFNVADSSIVVGVIVLALLLLREEQHRASAPARPAEAAVPVTDESQ